jgi:adenylate cyclase
LYSLEATGLGGDATVVVVFADLAGFTAFAERVGDFEATRAASRFVLRAMQIGRRHGLRPVKTLGDAVLFVGAEGVAALKAAVALVERFDGGDGTPPVHVGIHSGDVIEQDGDVYGGAVNLAARLVSLARPRQVLVTETVAGSAKFAGEAETVSLGQHALRGLGRSIELFEVKRKEGSAT